MPVRSERGAPRRRRSLAACCAVVLLVGGCSRPAERAQPVPDSRVGDPAAVAFAENLRARVTTDAMVGHLVALQDIADRHDGNRAVGTRGYDASVDYVAQALRDKGFDVQTPEFQTRVFDAEKPVLTVNGEPVEANVLRYTAGTPAPGIRGPLVAAPADETPGCAPSDYDGLAVKGAVVLVDRGSCKFVEKLAILTQLGAAAMVVADNIDEDVMPGALNEDNSSTVPAVSVSKADGARLRAAPGPATLTVDAETRTVTSRNVIAQTRTGSTENVVMAGAHLDSVPDGPGINDNGSGVAAVLEAARQLGDAPPIAHAVRFGFWGAEEIGTVGSTKYVASLNDQQLKDIALYLNFDMLASPNAGYFTYDGDQSTRIGRDQVVPRVPEGSAGIERTLVDYLAATGKPARDTFFDGRSDYDAFTRAGIPAGGLFAGAEEKKTAEQATLWGGTADIPFDDDYHKSADTVEHINREALGIQGGGVAYAVGLYAQDLDGRNGMPLRGDRTRHLLTES